MLPRRSRLAALLVLSGCAQIVGLDELREDREPQLQVEPGAAGVAGSTNARDIPAGGASGSGSLEGAGSPGGSSGGNTSPGGSSAGGSSAGGVGDPGGGNVAGGGPAGAPLGAALSDAGPATPLGPAACGQQLLANAAFDEGAIGWNEIWDARKVVFSSGDPLLIAAGVTPHSGNTLAWLGGVPNGEFGQKYTSSVQQEVVIPDEAIALSVSGQIWVQQPELGQPFPAVDWVVLELLDATSPDAPSIAWQIETWSDADVSPGWVAFEALNINEIAFLRGRRLLFSAASRPDGNGTLSVWLDSLRLEARCP